MNSKSPRRESAKDETAYADLDGHPVASGKQRPASFWRAMQAVAWGFFGVRRNSAYHEDGARLSPLVVIVAALVGVLVFIGVLLIAVRFAVAA